MKEGNFNYTALFYIILSDTGCLIKWEEGKNSMWNKDATGPFLIQKRNRFNFNASLHAGF